MTRDQRIIALNLLKNDFIINKSHWDEVIERAMAMNPWFTEKNIRMAITSICEEMLDSQKLTQWSGQYPEIQDIKKVGLIMAGNLPLVGFADWLSIFISGHYAIVKCSEKDNVLFPAIIERLAILDNETVKFTSIVEQLKGFDAVIATGSNNTALYFESYFKNVPHIIRKNRTSVAVIDAEDPDEVLNQLTIDIHAYFGLGCRNVSKIYLPVGFDIQRIMRALEKDTTNSMFNKYKNNFDYNLSIYMLNKISFYTDNNIILIEEPGLFSRIACLHFQWYESMEEIIHDFDLHKEDIQCIVSAIPIDGLKTILPGHTQMPALTDYADDIDTMAFLSKL